MSTQQPSSPLDNDSTVRKRVCKACDRCRLKKSKCDGSSPCNRCKSDNAICIFGERKKSHDKVYPKGYVEMLEQNHAQLVNGIQELYARAVGGQAWVGPPLKILPNGHPHIHDILESLGALKRDSRSGSAMFEEDLEVLQQKLYASGAGLMHQHDSPESDTDQAASSMSGIEAPPSKTFFTMPSYTPSSGLPTPPMQTPTMQTPTGRLSLHIPPEAQFRPQPAYNSQSRSSCPQPSMNPAVLHRPSWPHLVPAEGPMDFLQFEIPSYDNVKQMQFAQSQVDYRSMSPMGVPDWNEDIDVFNTFVNQALP
ncbi:MAG: C6 transcription factor [Lasallia pustulata]|uniref:C6 transcription factor n=1 Tax=Lasallia pustulata TaxID=136370 RepID=A0A5M8PI04_9LECA|nr:MAG: C6 transcription factor [Lasallia pustulata]